MKNLLISFLTILFCTLGHLDLQAQCSTSNIAATALSIGPTSGGFIYSCTKPIVIAEWTVTGQLDYDAALHKAELIVALPAQIDGLSGNLTISASDNAVYWNPDSVSVSINEVRVPLTGVIPSATVISIIIDDLNIINVNGPVFSNLSQGLSNQVADCMPGDNSNSTNAPFLNSEAPTIADVNPNCSNTNLIINLSASPGATNGGAITSYSWTGPNGFTSADQNPNIVIPQQDAIAYRGDYAVTVTDANGCTSADTISLNEVNCLALPIELLRFSATPVDEGVELEWETATEINNSHFDIERSADGRQYQKIGDVAGQGTTSEIIAYSFTDAAPLSGKSYYRLKQVDYNGAYEYSHIEEVNRDNDSALKLFPNPVAAGSQFRVEGRQIRSVQVFNILGQLVLEESYDRPQNRVFLSTDHLAQGMYITRINNTTEKRMIIK